VTIQKDMVNSLSNATQTTFTITFITPFDQGLSNLRFVVKHLLKKKFDIQRNLAFADNSSYPTVYPSVSYEPIYRLHPSLLKTKVINFLFCRHTSNSQQCTTAPSQQTSRVQDVMLMQQ